MLGSHLLQYYPKYKDICMLLFAAGETVFRVFISDDFHKKRLQNILKLEDPGIQLNHICSEAIRKHLLDLDPHSNLFCRIPLLGLPALLNLYLLYSESLDNDDDD